MIIDAFGLTYAAAIKLSQMNAVDDFMIQRPPVTARVGGMNSAFDFYGTRNYPVQPLTIKKSLTLSWSGTVTGTGTISGSHGTGPVYLDGSGTLFLTELMPGDTVNLSGGTCTVISISTNILAVIDAYPGSTASYTITHRPTRAKVERCIDLLKAATITQTESKLWGLRRDATKLWTWAKCTSLKVSDQVGNVYHLPATIEFYGREGLWYSESSSTETMTQASAMPVAVATVGDYQTSVIFTITSSTGTMTSFTLANATGGDTFTWTGSAGVGVAVVVNSGSYSVTKGGVGDYAAIAIGANQINWFRLAPGANPITLTVVGSTAWSATLTRYDTYL